VVPDVLAVQAAKLRNPVTDIVLTESHDPPPHRASIPPTPGDLAVASEHQKVAAR
jgi:hypothetical protein